VSGEGSGVDDWRMVVGVDVVVEWFSTAVMFPGRTWCGSKVVDERVMIANRNGSVCPDGGAGELKECASVISTMLSL